MSKIRIYETLDSAQGLSRETTSAGLRLSGVFGKCGVRNNNNRVYEKNNYGKMVQQLQEEIAAKHGVMGELEHPNSMNINLNNVSHKIEAIQMNEDGTVTGSIVLLNTDKGKQAQAIIEGGLDLYISSRATGSIDKNGNVVLESLKTYDLVGTPGFAEAKMSVTESLSHGQRLIQLNESCYAIVEGDDDDDDEADDKKDTCDCSAKIDELLKEIKALKELVAGKADKEDVEDEIEECRKWVATSFAQGVENWLTEEYVPANNDRVADATQKWLAEEFAPRVEQWVVEQYTPRVEKWICEEYAQVTENWITEQLMPTVEKWVCEEFAGQVNNWVTEHVMPEQTKEIADGVQGWIQEELLPNMDSWVTEHLAPEIYTNVNDFIAESKKTSIDTIDSMLDMLESKDTNPVQNMVNESKEDFTGNIVLESMPSAYQPLWNMCSEEKKTDILNRAKLYDMKNNSVSEQFWASIDFTAEPAGAPKQVNENLSNYQRAVLSGIRRLRKF